MARGRSGVISKEYKGEENTAYHDVIKLFKNLSGCKLADANLKLIRLNVDSIWSMVQSG